jgi:hypothetical protein
MKRRLEQNRNLRDKIENISSRSSSVCVFGHVISFIFIYDYTRKAITPSTSQKLRYEISFIYFIYLLNNSEKTRHKKILSRKFSLIYDFYLK